MDTSAYITGKRMTVQLFLGNGAASAGELKHERISTTISELHNNGGVDCETELPL